jgi:hypothetical protein
MKFFNYTIEVKQADQVIKQSELIHISRIGDFAKRIA